MHLHLQAAAACRAACSATMNIADGPRANGQTRTKPAAGEVVVRCSNLWKIFGDRSKEALAKMRSDGCDKQGAMDEFGCVIGVAHASFKVRDGEIFCVMGLSGSGKSTLVRHINRLIEPTAGEVWIGDTKISDLDEEAMRELRAEKIGMVFQHVALLPHRNVLENVGLALEIRDVDKDRRIAAAENALATVELADWGESFPAELSGGMQQRVGLARALAADPQILLMDEPFSALDPLIRRSLQDEFLELSRKMHKTTIFITHDLDEAIRLGDRIAIMKDGALVQVGTPEEIVTEPVDDYVSDFVAGISKLHLISAGRIMVPVPEEQRANGNMSAWPVADPSADLDELVSLSLKHNNPIAVKSGSRLLGMVSKCTLLRSIQGSYGSTQSMTS